MRTRAPQLADPVTCNQRRHLGSGAGPQGRRAAPPLRPDPGSLCAAGERRPGSTTAHGPLTVGGRADFAAFDVADEAALRAGGARHCVATVLAGRLVHRAR
ncbi:hypothetical protein SMICM17S_00608 [Streptomyces microflavus]